ncbi:selenocysteine-specific translation elongation factor [Actinomadura madurae]|uniref:Selenocysteine-specific elongation factor n=1 Tax=Actinomadura madurae TaxID=1993 RepID=A0A1I5L2M0_9ACTN|nr:selenocysteine-specific translation elongation factor [Actinomadura madurae]SFO91517.1 selenocysteine-specific elongation factor [Actinomadura madurae]SPT49379.1 SelB translation factor [Actinomadura madurae]
MMHVVATAGHVDHGKSTLVRALTGMEPDRLEEERRRGLTIELGFAWTTLPGGGRLAFVDVPGHERLVTTMLAGVGPVPAVMVVVAADQGWQRQSEEHLAVLDALGVRHGLLAVTRRDLTDAATAARVRDEALGHIAAGSLGEVEAVMVSGATGDGLDDLRAALERLTASLPGPDEDADVRLWIDRVFTVRGRGTVVTGTLGAGTISVGDRLASGGEVLRVRGLQSLKEDHRRVGAVARVAVNLHGNAGELGRGDALLTPGRWLAADVLDVRLHGDPARDLPRELVFHVGSAAVPAHVRPLGDDTARLSLRRALPLRVGDVALLRDPGRHRVPAGVTVLDVRPEPFTRRGAAASRAQVLATMTGRPDGAGELRRRGLIKRADLVAMGVPVPAEPVAGDWLADPDHWDGLRGRLETAVDEHAAANPTDPGLPADAARRALGLPDRALVEALAEGMRQRDGRIYGRTTAPELPPDVREAVDAVRRDLDRHPFRAPDAGRLAELGLTPKMIAVAAATGALLKVADGIVLLPGDDARAAALLAKLGGPFTLSEARRALGTTRRVAVPLLEHLDELGYTVRVDDLRRRCIEGTT